MNADDNRIIMIGEVSAVYPERATARVLFPDRDEMSSKELPVVFTRAFGVEVYAMPNVGEEVLCIFLPNGIEEGFIVGAYYNDKNPPPAKDKSVKIIKFEDGNYVKYTNGTFEFSTNVKAPLFIGDLRGIADVAKEANDN